MGKHAPVELIDELTQIKAAMHFLNRSVSALMNEEADESLALGASETFNWIERRLKGVNEALKKGGRK